MRDVIARAGVLVANARHLLAALQEAPAELGVQDAGAAGDDGPGGSLWVRKQS
jgi:hypothetical protein